MDWRNKAVNAYNAGKGPVNKEKGSGQEKKTPAAGRKTSASGEKAPDPGKKGPVPGRGDGVAGAAYTAPGKRELEGLIKTAKGGGGYKKVAKFLLLLGQREAAGIIQHFTPEEIEKITLEIAALKRIEKQEAQQILHEFGYLKASPHPLSGGPDVARTMLKGAFGNEKGEEIFRKVLPFQGEKPFAFLDDCDPRQFVLLLRKEPPSVLSVVLSFVSPKQASLLLKMLEPEERNEVVKRIARMERIAPDILVRMEEKLMERIRTQGIVVTEEVDGKSVLADILRNMNLSDEKRILDEIAGVDDGLFKDVKEKLFTMELITRIPSHELQKVLREFGDMEIAIMLKGKDTEITDVIFSNVSERRRQLISYESDRLGRMRREEVDTCTKEFLDYLRQLEERGELTVNREQDEYV